MTNLHSLLFCPFLSALLSPLSSSRVSSKNDSSYIQTKSITNVGRKLEHLVNIREVCLLAVPCWRDGRPNIHPKRSIVVCMAPRSHPSCASNGYIEDDESEKFEVVR